MFFDNLAGEILQSDYDLVTYEKNNTFRLVDFDGAGGGVFG